MTPALLLAAGLICAPPADGPESRAVPPTPDLAAYQQARDRAGRDADAQVRLALWCEAHGLPAERLKHLALAALRDPKNAAARGLMGMVRFQGRWSRPEAVARKVEGDADYAARLAEYHERREKAGPTADAQARLAQWCEEAGLEDKARAHHAAVLRVEPTRELSRKRLGYKKDGRRWVTDEQLAAEKEDTRLQKEADRKWKASLTAWRGWLGDDGPRRDQAARELFNVTDPRAVPSVLAVFARGKPVDRDRAVRLLGQIDAPGSSRALAGFAAFDESAEIRRAATETLKRRDPREFAGLLIGLLRKPIKFEVKRSNGPDSPGTLFIEGEKANLQRSYALPDGATLQPGDYLTYDRQGLPVIHRPMGTRAVSTGRITADQWMRNLGIPDPAYTPDLASLAGNPVLDRTPVGRQLKAMAPRGIAGMAGVGGVVAFDQTSVGQYLKALEDDPWNVMGSMSTTDFQPTVGPDSILAAGLASQIAGVEATEKKSPSRFGFGFNGRASVEDQISVGQMQMSAQRQLEADVAVLEGRNADARRANSGILPILSAVSGKDYGDDPTAWKAWWVDQIGYSSTLLASTSKPTYTEQVPLDTSGYVPGVVTNVSGAFRRMSCFGAGTSVRTLEGPKAIETLRVGDRVLTQSVADGSLGYHPITAVHHNPPSPTFLVRVAGDTIVSSPFHRFWAAGRGWVMARDLEGGEVLRLLEGTRAVDSVEAGPVQPVFNLDVSGDHDFFAGKAAALVHDNSLPDARLVPFDAAPGLAAVAATRGK